MVASLLNLLTSGLQDERLYGETLHPFQKVWIHAGRYTTRWERLEFDAVPTFGQTAQFRIIRKGHLVTRLYLVATMPDVYSVQKKAMTVNGGTAAYPRFGWTNSLGHAMVQQLTMDIGNARVETMDSHLLEIMDEFYTPLEKVPAVNRMIKRTDNGFTDQTWGWPAVGVPYDAGVTGVPAYQETVVVPLPFWFSRGDPASALPIDAIVADEVRCNVTFRDINGLYYTGVHQDAKANGEAGTGLWPMLGSLFYATDPSVVVTPAAPLIDPATGAPIQMPSALALGECYVMAEYVYLDQNEANRFRLADLQMPMIQHFAAPPFDSRGLPNARVRLDFPNPTRELYVQCSPALAASYNAHFLSTRDLTGNANTRPNGMQTPWWPDAVGLTEDLKGGLTSGAPMQLSAAVGLRPAFALSDSEPIAGLALEYQGSLVRYRTEAPALFRSVLPSYELRKSPWHNRYLYVLPFGIQNGWTAPSVTQGEANLDKVVTKELILQFRPPYGAVGLDVGRFWVRVYSEAYSVLRVYGGRAGLLY